MSSLSALGIPRPAHKPSQEHGLEQVTGYINAGGRGTRLNGLFQADPALGIAKALLEIGSPPLKLIDHHVASLSQWTLRNIVVAAGDQHTVAEHIRDSYGTDSSISATESVDQLGTGGDLVQAVREQPRLFGDRIVINNCDTILDIDTEAFVRSHLAKGAALSIALTRNVGVPNQDAFLTDGDCRVVYSHETKDNTIGLDTANEVATSRGSSTGALVVEKSFIEAIRWEPSDGQLSLYRHLMGAALRADGVFGYDNARRFFMDVGTIKTWTLAEQTGIVQHYLRYPHTTFAAKEAAS